MEQFKLIAEIGRGAFGRVYRSRDRTTGKILAIKITFEDFSQGEIAVQKELNHPNIVSLLQVVYLGRYAIMIMEYVPIDLRKYLRNLEINNQKYEPEEVRNFLYQIADAMQYCHERSLMHLDLKPANVMVNPSQRTIKVADFGMARSFAIPKPDASCRVGTMGYRAPELLLGSTDYSWPVDIWSIGCIFAELASRMVLFRGWSDYLQLLCIFDTLGTPTVETWPNFTSLPYYDWSFPRWTKNRLARKVTNLDEAGMDLLRKCLVCNPAGRISAKQIREHRYFDGFAPTNSSTK